MSKKTSLLWIVVLSILANVGVNLLSQQSGTPSQLRVMTDSAGYLLASGGVQTPPYYTSTFNNTRLRTDANGNLLVASSGGMAPVDAQYWVGAANTTLTAEKNLGALTTGLVINTGGVPTAYTGVTCTNQFLRILSAVGAGTCATVNLASGTDVTGALPIANGGSGAATWAPYTVLTNASGSTAAPTVTNDPKFLAGNGSSTATLRAGGVIYDSGYINSGNLADTNYVCQTTTIPANTLKNIGDKILVVADFVASSSGDAKVRQINIGFSSCAADGTGFTGGQTMPSNSTTNASFAETMVGTVLKSASNAQRTYGWTILSSGAVQGANIASTSNTDTSAINIGIAYKDQTMGTAGAITLLHWQLVYVPVP